MPGKGVCVRVPVSLHRLRISSNFESKVMRSKTSAPRHRNYVPMRCLGHVRAFCAMFIFSESVLCLPLSSKLFTL